MSNQLVRVVLRSAPRLSQRAMSSTAAVKTESKDVSSLDPKGVLSVGGGHYMDPELMAVSFPKLGNRDIVGFGMNGSLEYIERVDFPYPAIRFKENTPDVVALREKEKGDWKNLSLEDKKALYRASFCSTFAEMNTMKKGQWKLILALTLASLGLTYLFEVWLVKYVYTAENPTRELQVEQMARLFREKTGPIDGFTAKFNK